MKKIPILFMVICMILFSVITAYTIIKPDPFVINTGQQATITNLVGDSAELFVPMEVVYDSATKVVPALLATSAIQDISISTLQFIPAEVEKVSIAEIFSAIPIKLIIFVVVIAILFLFRKTLYKSFSPQQHRLLRAGI